MSEIRLNKEDVSLQDIPVENCTDCDEQSATCYIQIELRGAGITTCLGDGRYCEACGIDILGRIIETLPEWIDEKGNTDA